MHIQNQLDMHVFSEFEHMGMQKWLIMVPCLILELLHPAALLMGGPAQNCSSSEKEPSN